MEKTSKCPGCHDPIGFAHTCGNDKLTEKEIAVLKAIRDDEYRDGGLEQAVWSHNIDVPAGMTRRSMGGVFKSLRDKGYISLGGSGKEATVALLPPAIAFLTARAA